MLGCLVGLAAGFAEERPFLAVAGVMAAHQAGQTETSKLVLDLMNSTALLNKAS